MVRSALACGVVGFVLSAGLAPAQDQVPPLDPPSLVPPAAAPARSPVPARVPVTGPSSATSPSAAVPKPEQNHSLLLIPGVTAPAPPRPGMRPARPASPTVILDPPSPPSEPSTRNPTSPSTALPLGGRAPAPRDQLPLVLEAIPDDVTSEAGSEDLPTGRSAKPRPTGSNSPRLITDDLSPSSPSASSTSRPDRAQSRPSTTPFGRFLGPKGSAESTSSPSSSIAVEPRSDPADDAVRRRIEKQVEQTLGDRIRSVEVRVNGRTVVFRAQAVRFWQRRGVRRSLEALPLPSGYRGRVEMVD